MAEWKAKLALSVLLLFSQPAGAQPGNRSMDLKTQVVDVLLSQHVELKPYFSRMVLRFGDRNTQITIVVYQGGKAEIIRHAVLHKTEELEQLIASAVARNSTVTPQDIASSLRASLVRSDVNYARVIAPRMEQLKSIRLSPLLNSSIPVDSYSQFEFAYDTWTESVHYVVNGPFKGEPQDELVKWMLSFRNYIEEQLQADAKRR